MAGKKGWVDWGKWGTRAMVVSDALGTRANAAGAKMGVERFWPTSNDFREELEKCERILRTFTVEGLPTEETVADGKKKRKVYRKIPPKVIQDAKGIVIFNSMRTGIAPFAGAGGAGIIVARLPDGQWSAPSFISPNSYSAGLMLGIDVYQCVLILRTFEAVKQFHTHNVTLGTEMAIAAGPLGYGISGEAGLKNGQGFKSPIFSYVLSKGMFAGIEVVGQAFIDRFDENERVYHWPGIKAGDILTGKVRRPPESTKLYSAILDAEMGVAQGASLEWDTEEVSTLDLGEGEVLKLPPTPEQLMAYEAAGIKDEEDVKAEEEDRKAVRSLPPPPRHPHSRNTTARKSDSSLLNGRTAGMRSPALGKSASECSSPNADASFSDEPEQHATQPDLHSITATSFALPPRHPARSSGRFVAPALEPMHVPVVQQAGEDVTRDVVPEAQQVGQEAVEQAEAEDADKEPKKAEDHSKAVTADLKGLGISDSPPELQPPPLQHQDSSTSSISQYSDAADTTVPPEYEAGDAPQEVKEKSDH